MGNRVVVKEKKKNSSLVAVVMRQGSGRKWQTIKKSATDFSCKAVDPATPPEGSQQRWSAPHFSEGRVPVSEEEKNVATNGERWVKSWGREDTKSRAVMTSERRPHMKPTATTDLLPRLQSGPCIIPSGFAPPSVDWLRLSCPKNLDS